MKIDTIYLDSDGVLADFHGAACELCAKHTGKDIPWPNKYDFYLDYGLSAKDFWSLIEDHEGFWSSIPQLPWAMDLFYACSAVAEVRIATSASSSFRCPSEKLEWFFYQLGIFSREVITIVEKERLARPGALLIDDLDTNCSKFLKAGGAAWRFPARWWFDKEITTENVLMVLEYRTTGQGELMWCWPNMAAEGTYETMYAEVL